MFSWGSPTCSQPLPEQRSVGLQEQVLKKPVKTDKTPPVHVTPPCHQPPRVGFQWCQQLAAGSGQQGGGCRSQRCAAQCPAPAPPGHKPGIRVLVRWGWVSASWNHFLEATDEVTKCPVWGYACLQRRGLWQSGLAAGGGSRPRPLGQGSAEAVPEHLLPPAWPGGSLAAVCSPLGRLTLDWRGPLPPPSPSPSPRLAGSIHSAPPLELLFLPSSTVEVVFRSGWRGRSSLKLLLLPKLFVAGVLRWAARKLRLNRAGFPCPIHCWRYDCTAHCHLWL